MQAHYHGDLKPSQKNNNNLDVIFNATYNELVWTKTIIKNGVFKFMTTNSENVTKSTMIKKLNKKKYYEKTAKVAATVKKSRHMIA